MTEITYVNGVVVVSQYGVSTIRFRPCDLNFNSRTELVGAVMDMPISQEAGVVGFLKTQAVEARQEALEEALGISFPLGMGDEIDGDEAEQIVRSREDTASGECGTIAAVMERLKGGDHNE